MKKTLIGIIIGVVLFFIGMYGLRGLSWFSPQEFLILVQLIVSSILIVKLQLIINREDEVMRSAYYLLREILVDVLCLIGSGYNPYHRSLQCATKWRDETMFLKRLYMYLRYNLHYAGTYKGVQLWVYTKLPT